MILIKYPTSSSMPLCRLCLVLLFLHMVVPSPLTCEVRALAGGQTQYSLSSGVGQDCEMGWEDQNKTVLTRGTEVDSVVVSLSEQTLVLNTCRSFLHFTAQCGKVFKEACCFFDCSAVPQALKDTSTMRPGTPAADQSTGVCVGGRCMDRRAVIAPLVLFVLLLLCVLLFCVCKPKKKKQDRPGVADV